MTSSSAMNGEVMMKKWTRLEGTEREEFQRQIVQLYEYDWLSVRQICQRTGRSYGSVHKLLVDAGVQMRPRGNPSHG